MHQTDISVIVPFYKGNAYINELLKNVDQTAQVLQRQCGARMEVIIINDSPEVAVEQTAQITVPVRVIPNEVNLGIHGSRVHGLKHAKGQWIQFLDQDDLLMPEHYPAQYRMAQDYDVMVGNGLYYYGENSRSIFPNRAVMQYYIQEKRFIMIRDLIASPGHCLIRKEVISSYWKENTMKINGADDYFLWMVLYHRNARFGIHENQVYVHRNNAEGNLSFDLERMHRSNCEMCDLLNAWDSYPAKKHDALRRSIVFKYLYDTKKMRMMDWVRYFDKVVDNGMYRIATLVLSRKR
jgi:glycosyltransferase involved in cell wall biosynthesis